MCNFQNTELNNVVSRLESDGHTLLYVTRFGSHIYGTSTKDSDTDFRGIFELFNNYNRLFDNRNIKSFLGYISQQTRKYGLKGERVGILKVICETIDKKYESLSNEIKLRDFIMSTTLLGGNQGNHLFIKNIRGDNHLCVCGKMHNLGIGLKEFYERTKNEYDKYGQRAKDAENNENIDWKAVSHAIRCIEQAKQILHCGYVQFPLTSADYILDVKLGNVSWDECNRYISKEVEFIEKMKDGVSKITKVNRKYIETFLVSLYNEIG